MRFPLQKRKVEQPTDFPLKLNTDNLNWCRDARLLLIEGNGTLKCGLHSRSACQCHRLRYAGQCSAEPDADL